MLGAAYPVHHQRRMPELRVGERALVFFFNVAMHVGRVTDRGRSVGLALAVEPLLEAKRALEARAQ